MSVKIEQDKKMAEVNIPFLVITQKLNDIILCFNEVKHLAQNKNDTVNRQSISSNIWWSW